MATEKNVTLNPGAYPVLRIALLYAAGIAAGSRIPDGFNFERLPVVFIMVLTATIWLHLRKTASLPLPGRQYLPPSGLKNALYLLCITGFGLINAHQNLQPYESEEHILSVFEPDHLLFHGIITSSRTTRSDNRLVRVNIDSVQINGLPAWINPFVTEVLIRQEDMQALRINDVTGEHIKSLAGKYLRFRGDLQRPSPPGNPHQFDYPAFLARQGIYSQIFTTEIISVGDHTRIPFWLRQQTGIKSRLEPLFSDKNRPLAKAIILGDRSDLDSGLRTGFSRVGLAHLMAVSGMHVGFVLMPVWFILPWFRRSPTARFCGLLLGGTLLLLYAGVTGFSVSVSRASLMAFFLMIARLYHKPGTSMNILGAAAFILLLTDPVMLFDVGFQLSFLAVIIILVTLPGTRYLLPRSHRYRKTGAIFQFVMVSVLVQGGLYPVLVYYFQEFSLAGPISNTLAVPFVQLMFLWTFVCLGISLIEPAFATPANLPGDLILTKLTHYVTFVGSHSSSWIESAHAGSWIFGIWFFGIALIGSLRIPALRWQMVCGFLCCLLLFQADKLYERIRRPEFTVTFFDVGQADAILLETPGGLHYLYDTGLWTPQFNSGERILIPELKSMGIRKLDGIILSHPHADHIGGMVSLLNEIPVDTIYQSPAVYNSRIYHRYMSLAGEKEVPVRLLSTGDLITTDPSLPMLVLAPSEKIRANDPNNRSVVLMILYGNTRLLLSGDAEKEAETFMVETFGAFLKSDLLKIGHHGSRTSSTESFLSKVGAHEGVASVALRNRYQHPHPEAMERLQRAGVTTRFTSLDGAIIYRSDGREFEYIHRQ